MAEPFLKDFKTYPRMVRWFNPILLRKLLNNVVTSSMFGQFADRRLMVAALDSVPAQEAVSRASAIRKELKADSDGAVWITAATRRTVTTRRIPRTAATIPEAVGAADIIRLLRPMRRPPSIRLLRS